jgi:hypothetical protein
MPSKPQYGLGSKKFNDFFDYFQGYAKTPQELGLVYPFPQQYTDSQGRVWVLQQGEVPDNHQFNRKREISFQNQVYYKVRNKEKYQDPKPKWDSQSAQTPSLLSQLKKKNLIGQ